MGTRRGGLWLLAMTSVMALTACRQPAAPTAPLASAPVTTATPSTATETPAAPSAPTAVVLSDIGLSLTPAEGWTRQALPAKQNLLPTDPQPAVFEGPERALLVVAKVAEANLGGADPAKAPAAIIAGLRKSLDAGLVLADASAPAIAGLSAAQALKANGAFPALGLGQATATFVCGVGEQKQVLLLATFAPNEAAAKALDQMVASLTPSAAEPAK